MSEPTAKRPHRVAQLLQEELGKLFVHGLKDPRVGFVTVTEVQMTPDLREATVYVSAMGDDAARHKSLAGLQAAAGFLRRHLGHVLPLRFAPALHFCLDTTLDRAQRLEAVLAAARAGATTPPAAAPAEALPEADIPRLRPAAAAPPGRATRRRRPASRSRSR